MCVSAKIYVCEWRMYVCESARMNYGLNGPSYVCVCVCVCIYIYIYIYNMGVWLSVMLESFLYSSNQIKCKCLGE